MLLSLSILYIVFFFSFVSGLNTKQSFSPQPLDNVLDTGGYDNINPNVFRGKRTHGQLNFNQYQGQQVNFSQPYHSPQNNNSWENNILWAVRDQ